LVPTSVTEYKVGTGDIMWVLEVSEIHIPKLHNTINFNLQIHVVQFSISHCNIITYNG